MRILVSLVLLVLANAAFAQTKLPEDGLSEKRGILFLESAFNDKSPYFIETSISDFNSLLKVKDTVTVIAIGTPGDHASDESY